MISAINSINSSQYNVNFDGRGKRLSAKKIKKGLQELPYTLGLKKKKTFWQKLKGVFVKEKTFGEKVKEGFKELPYKLGLKKKKTFGQKVADFFTFKSSKVKKNGKDVLTETEPKQDGLFKVLGKDFVSRVKKADEILIS